MTKEEHDRLTYVRYGLPFGKVSANYLDTYVSATPIRLFGKTVLIKWVLAKPGYPWSNY